ncbi:MAG: S41 family peptidase [Nanoarchaeota archaeon]
MIFYFDDILYINIARFENASVRNLFSYLIKEINHPKLIIDLRANGGGYGDNAKDFLSFFIPRHVKVPIAKYLRRINENDPELFDQGGFAFTEIRHEYFFQGPIVVLTGNQTKSNAEYVVLGLKALREYRKVILVGDTTFGSSGNAKLFSHDGIGYKIPSWVWMDPHGKILENHGIRPDIHIPSTISWGKDKAFEAAIKILKEM